MQLDYDEQKEMKKECVKATQEGDDSNNILSRNYRIPLSEREAKSKFADAKTLGLKYDYEEIGSEYRYEFLNDSKSNINKK